MLTLEIKMPITGEQVNSHVFKVNRKYYHGRVEEARKYYARHEDIYEKYSFNQFVEMTYTEYKKPKRIIKEEILTICADSDIPPSKITKILCLLNKL